VGRGVGDQAGFRVNRPHRGARHHRPRDVGDPSDEKSTCFLGETTVCKEKKPEKREAPDSRHRRALLRLGGSLTLRPPQNQRTSEDPPAMRPSCGFREPDPSSPRPCTHALGAPPGGSPAVHQSFLLLPAQTGTFYFAENRSLLFCAVT